MAEITALETMLKEYVRRVEERGGVVEKGHRDAFMAGWNICAEFTRKFVEELPDYPQ